MPAKKKTSTPKKQPPRFILIIEDNSHHAELITELIDKNFSPAIIHTVDSVSDGMSFAQRNSYDLIITAGMVGGQQIAKQLPKLVSIAGGSPIIVISGQGDEAFAAQLIKLGASEYLPKTRETLDELPLVLARHMKKNKRPQMKSSSKVLKEAIAAPTPAEIIREVERITQEALSLASAKRRRRSRSDNDSNSLDRLLAQIKNLRDLAHKMVK